MARVYVGLDIGSSCVKAVQLRRRGKELELEKYGVAEVNPGGPPPTGATAREAKVRAIQTALANGKITAKSAVSAVSGEPIIVRYIQLPDMPENELREALKWEAQEYVPFELDEVNIDSTVLGKSEDGSMVNVLLVAAKKDLLSEHIGIIRQAKLQPEIIDVDSFAFMNCFEANYAPMNEEAIALVNIGSNVTNINIFSHGVSLFSRDIALAGDAITTAIQTKLNKDWHEAEQLKLLEGAPEPAHDAAPAFDNMGGDDDNSSLLETIRGTVERLTGESQKAETPEELASKMIKTTLDNLLNEIRRSLQFFENQANGRPVKQLMLGGGASRMSNLTNYIQTEMKMQADVMDPLNRIRPSGKSIDLSALDSVRNMLGVSVGLALRKV
ncbi:type IV pilus assembly protein PilM [Candidatus Sumerlaeota bacterium]|nr:type IV pilus assembly protein PilM [Candidatus Sumerlaeota bacterium]